MKILLVNKYWYIRGGAERVVFATKKVLEDAGHEVEIFGMKHPDNIMGNDYFIDEIDYAHMGVWAKIQAGIKSIHNKDAKQKFEKLVQTFKPDIVHFHNIYHQLSFSLLDIVKKYNIPSVMTLHDYKMISPNYNLYHHGRIDDSCCNGSYYRCILSNCMEHIGQSIFATLEAYDRRGKKYTDVITTYISPSEFLKHKFQRCGFTKHIEVIPNPLDLDEYIHEAQAGEGVVYFGRMSDEKGVAMILDIARQTPQITYTMVGDGPLREKLESQHLKNVYFVGYKQAEELRQMIAQARLIIMPSQWYENYPMSILEAKAMGKVVIASDIGGIGEMLPHDMLVRHDDVNAFVGRIKSWYRKDDKELIAVGKKLQKDVHNTNSIDRYAQHIQTLYERIA